jgi:hypothetical protein
VKLLPTPGDPVIKTDFSWLQSQILFKSGKCSIRNIVALWIYFIDQLLRKTLRNLKISWIGQVNSSRC